MPTDMNHSPLIHHISVINDNVQKAFTFYNKVLGLDLLMKTVNQDDLSMYHLFFSDTKGRPGTEFTVFAMADGDRKVFGTDDVERTIFAVPSNESLFFWEERLNEYGLFNCEIEDYNDSSILRFEDYDGVQLGLVPVKKDSGEYFGRETDEISSEHMILGIDSVHLRVRYPQATANILEELYGLSMIKETEQSGLPTIILSKPNTLFNQEIHIIEDKENPVTKEGVGSVHHIAFSVKSKADLERLEEQITERNFTNSGIKNREFFHSIYFREPNKLLIETATEETELIKETYDGLSFDEVPLYLPSFLERKRRIIEQQLL